MSDVSNEYVRPAEQHDGLEQTNSSNESVSDELSLYRV